MRKLYSSMALFNRVTFEMLSTMVAYIVTGCLFRFRGSETPDLGSFKPVSIKGKGRGGETADTSKPRGTMRGKLGTL